MAWLNDRYYTELAEEVSALNGTARLYKQKISDKEIFYKEIVCDLLKNLTQICDIAISNKDDVGLLYDKNKLEVLKLNR